MSGCVRTIAVAIAVALSSATPIRAASAVSYRLVVDGKLVRNSAVVFASGVLVRLMDDYPVIVYLGAALLGRVAGQMIVTDAFTVQTLAPSATLRYVVEAGGAIGVVITGAWLKTRRLRPRNLST